jgi:hypothetical protein
MEDTIKPETEGFASVLFGIDICIVYEAKAIYSMESAGSASVIIIYGAKASDSR